MEILFTNTLLCFLASFFQPSHDSTLVENGLQFLKILIDDLGSDVCALSLKVDSKVNPKKKRLWERKAPVDKESVEENRSRFYNVQGEVKLSKATVDYQVKGNCRL